MLLDKIQLEEGEKIIIQTRRHWFILFSQLLGSSLAAIGPLILVLIYPALVPDNLLHISLADYTPHLIYLYSAWLLMLWIGAFGIWTNYYLDILTLTDRRVIVVNQKGFFWRYTGSFRLERLQDMNIEINGILATMLDYGTINIETAGHNEEGFKVTNLPHPRELKTLIMQASDARLNQNPPTNEGL